MDYNSPKMGVHVLCCCCTCEQMRKASILLRPNLPTRARSSCLEDFDAVVTRIKNGSASPSIDMTVSPALFDTIWHLSAVQPSTATQNSSYVYRREDRSTMKCRHRLSSVSPDQGTIGRSFGSSYCSFYAAPSSQMGGLKHEEVPPSSWPLVFLVSIEEKSN